MDATLRYEEFHGKPPRRSTGIRFHVPRKLIYLGEAIAIEYKCNKLNGGGDGKAAVYRHEFETPAIVCMDESGRRQLYVVGGEIAVTDRGIIR